MFVMLLQLQNSPLVGQDHEEPATIQGQVGDCVLAVLTSMAIINSCSLAVHSEVRLL